MSVVKEQEYARLLAISMCRNEQGLHALREQLYARRDQINRDWPGQVGENLIRLQGGAQEIARLIRMIDEGPTIKPDTGGSK